MLKTEIFDPCSFLCLLIFMLDVNSLIGFPYQDTYLSEPVLPKSKSKTQATTRIMSLEFPSCQTYPFHGSADWGSSGEARRDRRRIAEKQRMKFTVLDD